MNIIRSVLARLELFNTRFNELKKTRNVYKKRNSIILSDFNRKSRLNRVNLHYWKPVDGSDNLGDYLSTVVVNYLVPDYQNIILGGGKHLYAIGSILGFGCQDATVWGSGLLNPYPMYLERIKIANLDIRAVRGPKTRKELIKLGKSCPDVYGDPAILMPEIYMPKDSDKIYRASLITHLSENDKSYPIHRIDMRTNDYRHVIDEIVKSELIISS